MELKLSLGDSPSMPTNKPSPNANFHLSLSPQIDDNEPESSDGHSSAEPSLQLNLLPLQSMQRQPNRSSLHWLQKNSKSFRNFDVNEPAGGEEVAGAASSSPNSAVSSFQLDFSGRHGNGGGDGVAMGALEAERASSRASDEDEVGGVRKKLRLSKQQSAFLEDSFKEHHTLNPKQKIALAKQFNLRPRQVEVWFQNRRARTKLKQTEVDCEYLKRCCEKLTEENRRLQKELSELRALKTAHPFYMHLPATTLSMCPSCERVASTNTSSAASASAGTSSIANPASSADPRPNSFAALFSKPRIFQIGSKPVASQTQPQSSTAA